MSVPPNIDSGAQLRGAILGLYLFQYSFMEKITWAMLQGSCNKTGCG
jgi:hypothetical protein